ncbi:universal stress protein [Methanobrevibacter filiformis]|uniref:Putative universal stress protein n=1 Tax=Methanobrevibacter filiformis TaxID=55758 RepID=A0A166AVE8_9EURY|nr:universal stress protein [Methanobrevibacter filiformis]KZX12518.1 putative universal stress protein [Methanobrevibacter filiformis]
MFKNIMVPLDGSTHSSKAEDIAINLAKRLNAKLTVVYVIDEISQSSYDFLENEGDKVLDDITKKGNKSGITVAIHSITGDPLRDMKVIAEKTKVDSVIISSHGKNSVERNISSSDLTIGSVADRVIKTFDIPVILIK